MVSQSNILWDSRNVGANETAVEAVEEYEQTAKTLQGTLQF